MHFKGEVYSSSGDELRDVKELNNDTGRRKRRKPMQDPSRYKFDHAYNYDAASLTATCM